MWHYGLAIGSVAIALGITQWLERYTTLRTPVFYAAILMTAWFGGMGPGLFAAAFATLALGYYFSPPVRMPAAQAVDLPFLLSFALLALLTAWVSAKRKRMEEALQHAHDELEAKVQERTADLQRVNAELRRSEAYLVEGQRLTHTGSWAWNVAAREYIYWSQEHCRMFGFDPVQDTPSYQRAMERMLADDLSGFEETLATAIREKKDFALDFRIVLPDGSIRYLHSLGHPVVDHSGAVVQFIGTTMDLTERKHAEETLQRAQAELAYATRVMTLGEMTASIAHEVNQPLAAIVTNSEACVRLLAGAAPHLHESRQAVQQIIQDAQRASAVIGRIRAMAKKTPPHRDSSDINEVIREVISLARGEIHSNGVELHLHLSDGLPPILADRVQLQQVMLNLIINGVEAISGVEDGPRALCIRSDRNKPDGVLVVVRDTGIGLAAESLAHLFDAFYTTKPEGLGMGLAISRSIIEAHGGQLWATPNTGPGASFQCTLPLPNTQQA